MEILKLKQLTQFKMAEDETTEEKTEESEDKADEEKKEEAESKDDADEE